LPLSLPLESTQVIAGLFLSQAGKKVSIAAEVDLAGRSA